MRHTTMNMFLRQLAIHSILLKHVHGGTHVNVQGLDHLHRQKVQQVRHESGRRRGFVSFTLCIRSGRRKRPRVNYRRERRARRERRDKDGRGWCWRESESEEMLERHMPGPINSMQLSHPSAIMPALHDCMTSMPSTPSNAPSPPPAI